MPIPDHSVALLSVAVDLHAASENSSAELLFSTVSINLDVLPGFRPKVSVSTLEQRYRLLHRAMNRTAAKSKSDSEPVCAAPSAQSMPKRHHAWWHCLQSEHS